MNGSVRFSRALALTRHWSFAFLVIVGTTPASGEEVDTTYPLQQAGTLYLDTAALPDTVPSAQPDWSYFAWNTFIAMNWPALEATPDQYRGIPDTSKSFTGAANDDLTVWESLKEKREVFNHPNTAGTLTWYAPVDYGQLRIGDHTATTSQRTFHDGSGTGSSPDAFDETVEVQSQSLEKTYPDGTTNPIFAAVPPVVTPRVWKGKPSDLNPVVYEVKLNYDYFNYVVNKGFNNDNSYQGNAIAQAASKAQIHLPYRTSSSKPPGGQNMPVINYRANEVEAQYEAINSVYAYNQQNPGSPHPVPLPPMQGAVQIKSAWVKLGGEDARASDYPEWHTAQAQYYQEVNGVVTPSEASLFGLVGLHIIQRIHTTDPSKPDQAANPVGGTFIFSTWEHTSIFNSPAQGSGGTPTYYYSNYFGGSPFGTPAAGFYPPLDKDVYPVERIYPVLDNVKQVNQSVHSAIKAVNPDSVWLNYHLVGTQFQAIGVADTAPANPPYPVSANDPTGIGQPVFLSNLAIETNVGLQHFQGQPPTIAVIDNYVMKVPSNTALGFERDHKNMAFNGTGYNMGGCMGCHGVAQTLGYSFSFVLLDGFLGAVTDTQEHFDQPGADPNPQPAPPNPPPMDIKSSTLIPNNSAAPGICPDVCSTMTWNGNWSPTQSNPDNIVCGTTNGYDIPVGYFDGQAGAQAHCQQQISLVTWNGQWTNAYGPYSVCGCQPPQPLPKP